MGLSNGCARIRAQTWPLAPVAPVAPVVPQPPVVYDVEDDPEIEVTFSRIRPRYQIPSNYREIARNIKREKR